MLTCGIVLVLAGIPRWEDAAKMALILSTTVSAAVIGWLSFKGGGGARRDQVALFEQAIAPILGFSVAPTGAVRLVKWSRGKSSIPQQIFLRYAPGVDWRKPTWKTQLLETASRLLGASWRVSAHDPRRCVLTLSPAPADPLSHQPQISRAGAAARVLLGESAKITSPALTSEGELTSFSIEHQAIARVSSPAYCRKVERTMASTLPGRWRARWDFQNDEVQFEVIPTLPDSIWMPRRQMPDSDDLLETYKSVEIPLGVGVDGQEITWPPAVLPQMLVNGPTGRGKTSFVTGVVAWAALFGWPVWISDAKRVEFLNLRDWPNVQIVAGTIETQVALIHRAWELMEHRYQLLEEGGARIEDFEPLFVVLDEHTEFVSALLPWYQSIKKKGDPAKPPVMEKVASLARKARTARIHLVVSLQRPDVNLIGGGEFRDNFGMRVSLGRLTPTAAQMMWQDPSVGVSLPVGKIGRAMITNAADIPVETQTYRVPGFSEPAGSEAAQLLEALRPSVTRHERLLILTPKEEEDEEGETIEVRYDDIANAPWVKAADHPHLDPLNRTPAAAGAEMVDGRVLASPMAMLGLLDPTSGPTATQPRSRTSPKKESDAFPETEPWSPDPLQEQYNVEEFISPSDLSVGDLIEIDGQWAVVSEEPIEDFDVPDHLIIPLRIEDEDDMLSVPIDELIGVRRASPTLEGVAQ